MIHLTPCALAAAISFLVPTQLAAQNTIAQIVVAASGGVTAGTFDQNNADYDILLTALTTANLTSVVADPAASLTVFAPSDRSFITLARDLGYTGSDEAGTWQFLVNTLTTLGNGNPVPLLTDILLYHVAPGRVTALDVIRKSLYRDVITTSLAGATIRPFFLVLIDNEPNLRNPLISAPINLRASNGIIHGINRVLIPVDLP